MELPKILKRCRNSKDFTQAQVAKILHVSRKTISNWESGRSDPDLKMLTKISDLYQVSTDILLQNRDIKNNRIFTISYILNIFLLFLTYLNLFNFFEPESKIFPLLLIINMFPLSKNINWRAFADNTSVTITAIISIMFTIISLITYNIRRNVLTLLVHFHSLSAYQWGCIFGFSSLVLIVTISFVLLLISFKEFK